MSHIKNREMIVETLREELVGPSLRGKPRNFAGNVHFNSSEEAYQPYQQENGEEVVQRDPPIVRYGVGVLYPIGEAFEGEPEQEADAEATQEEPAIRLVDDTFKKELEKAKEHAEREGEPDDDDLELPTYNTLKPSSMGVSFLAELPTDAVLTVTVLGGQYRPKEVTVMDREPYVWWLRKPISFEVGFNVEQLKVNSKVAKVFDAEPLKLSVEVFIRPHQSHHLVTVTLINRTKGATSGRAGNEMCLFQSELRATVTTPKSNAHILPYPSSPQTAFDEEEESLALLYRKRQTFAVGHGCAADWEVSSGQARAILIRSASLPAYETPSITPDIERENGIRLEVPMALLAGLVEKQDGFGALEEVIDRYERWINERTQEAATPELFPYHKAAVHHLADCRSAAKRMRDGLDYLKRTPVAKKAFQLANHAVLIQQVQSKRTLREARFDRSNNRYKFLPPYALPEILNPENPNVGRWRAFQIAFLLMSLQSSVEGSHPDRKRVELIWFPTGGGKTEAYLGLVAFAMFMRRLENPKDTGVHTLMRYTLRLLTAQQFQRASALTSAMEHLRQMRASELGETPFSIGIWLGGATTPNHRKAADHALKELERLGRGENPFILSRCPWCAAPMGIYEGSLPKSIPRALKILGYKRAEGTVRFHCPDRQCEFHSGLPVYVIDEDIYEVKPSLVIGTVDKFAVLAWKPEARTLFGINRLGKRETSPPGLIIQDELHLISGPLGSMVGLYEALIEELCTDRRSETATAPKIICSTATIRSFRHQIKALYNREDVTLFPPPGLEEGDSFFARHARDKRTGELLPGRRYVGVFAPGLRSIETAQERAFAALLQAPMPFSPEERDPWWTLMLFFGSLRELGTSLSLFQSRVPDYLKAIRQRWGLDYYEMRRLRRPEELTGRLRNDEVPKALAKLEIACNADNMWSPESKPVSSPPVDVCLTSSIIEVGVDVDRLSLMAVVRQPKTTSQYIQVTGRIGRKWWERPGLVVTLYNPKNARDISHFEHFRSYHEKLYAQVEPTSVTPFSPSVSDRALHGVMAAYAMQMGNEAIQESPQPYPYELVGQLQTILMPRVRSVDPREANYFEEVFNRRAREWQTRERTKWYTNNQSEDIPLMVRAGEFVSSERERLSWKTPTSMRNVDAECQAHITMHYLADNESEDSHA
ncbi:MAG: hypothetical protein KGZ60_13890 [Truepera sp.]|nr:hypothetical protein [Truepera sp.]